MIRRAGFLYCREAKMAKASHSCGGRGFESRHGSEILSIAHFDSGVLYVSRHRYRAELNC